MTEKRGNEEGQLPARVPEKVTPEEKRLIIQGLFFLSKVLSILGRLKNFKWKKHVLYLLIGALIGALAVFVLPMFGKGGETHIRPTNDLMVKASYNVNPTNKAVNFILLNQGETRLTVYGIVGKNAAGKRVVLRGYRQLKSLKIIMPDLSVSPELECWELADIDTVYFYFIGSDLKPSNPIKLAVMDICNR